MNDEFKKLTMQLIHSINEKMFELIANKFINDQVDTSDLLNIVMSAYLSCLSCMSEFHCESNA